MKIKNFLTCLEVDFFAGVPDSLLKPLCDYLVTRYTAFSSHHITAANEGLAVAMAAGHYLSTRKVAAVYLQNSGIGNIINAVTSLLSCDVYGIPCLFLVGWRGEPGLSDEPQHVTMGMVSKALLEDAGLEVAIFDQNTTEKKLEDLIHKWKNELFPTGRSAALLIRKGSIINEAPSIYQNQNPLTREEIIRMVLAALPDSIFVSTTGKASRELFELREQNGQNHENDFLTVGSMGHSSSLALGIAIHNTEKQIVCIDGDGAALMHLGAMATIGQSGCKNLIHIIINNQAHESVGGMPTTGHHVDFVRIAEACGYTKALRVSNRNELDNALKQIQSCELRGVFLLEVASAIGSRADLGRPTQSPKENITRFMKALE